MAAPAAVCAGLSALCPAPSAQRLPPAVNSNLEQTPSGGQTRRPLQPANGPVVLPDDLSRVRLAPGYTVDMEVFGIPELTQTLAVDNTGAVVVPMIGAVPLAGKTLREAEAAIAAALVDKEIVNAPTVTLTLTQFTLQGVTVSGEVQTPGEIRLFAPRPLLRVLADAGGVTTSAGGEIELRHRDLDGAESIRHFPYLRGTSSPEADRALVYPGDTVFIGRAGIVYVLGAVTRPGGYLMVNSGSLNLPEAIGLAEGVTLVSAPKTVIVVRKIEDQMHTYNLRLDKMSHGAIPAFQLIDGDMVYVPTSGVKSTLVTYSAILSAAASASIIAGSGR